MVVTPGQTLQESLALYVKVPKNMRLSTKQNKLVFFVWRHLDAFIGMQSFLDARQPPSRPSYKDITSHWQREQKHFPSAFEEDPETTEKMMAIRAKKKDVLSVGLWPLDFEPCFDWRKGGKRKRILNDYMRMAKIEIIVVDAYRKRLLKDCPEAAFIRNGVATHLDAFCKPTIKPVGLANDGKANKGKKMLVRKFHYADTITIASSPSDLPTVNVQAVKLTRQATANSKVLIADIGHALKKVERLKAAAAAPGSRMMDGAISEKISELKLVSN